MRLEDYLTAFGKHKSMEQLGKMKVAVAYVKNMQQNEVLDYCMHVDSASFLEILNRFFFNKQHDLVTHAKMK